MKPSNEFCINFLKASGWLDNHDRQIRADAFRGLTESEVKAVKNVIKCMRENNERKEAGYNPYQE